MQGYFAFIHPPEDGSSWGVTFPDVPGCVGAADSFEEAVHAAREALSGHIAALVSDGDRVPRPRLWVDISADSEAMAEAAGAFVHYVIPRRVPGERVRVNIMIDKGLLRVADETADALGLNRSAFIEEAISRLAEPADT